MMLVIRPRPIDDEFPASRQEDMGRPLVVDKACYASSFFCAPSVHVFACVLDLLEQEFYVACFSVFKISPACVQDDCFFFG